MATSTYKKAKWQRTPKWRDKDKIGAIERAAKRLGMTIEHVIPLRGEKVSGLHVHNNLAIVWQDDNFAKSNAFHIYEEAPEMTTSSTLTPRQKEIKMQKDLISIHSIKTCTNCEHWGEKVIVVARGEMPNGVIESEKTEYRCMKWKTLPPPQVIVVGCEDHEDDIPF